MEFPARRRWIARVGALTPSAPCLPVASNPVGDLVHAGFELL
jgi:hypothetical protein